MNASLNDRAPSKGDREKMLDQLSDVVVALKANFGVQVFANGEKLAIIDEKGKAIRSETPDWSNGEMAFTANPRGTVVIPMSVSGIVEQLAQNIKASSAHQG
jgi:mannose-1-phosphate guanylyltransferase/phosphomannomutase